MTKRFISIPTFLTAWLFAFSLLSNCYCLPAFVSEKSAQPVAMQSKMPAHCEHHSGAAKNKSSDCAPRFNIDHFESIKSQAHFDSKAQPDFFVIPEIFSAPDFSSEEISKIFLLRESPPPQFFLLHHSFLI